MKDPTLHQYEEDRETSTGETRGAVRRRLRAVIRREDCEAAAQCTAEEIALVSEDEQRAIRALSRGEDPAADRRRATRAPRGARPRG